MSRHLMFSVVCLLVLLFGNANGQWGEIRTEISPEIVPGTVPVGVPVRIDVYFDLVDPDPPVLFFYLYARFVGYDGLSQAAPVTPDSGVVYAGNVAVLNNFDANWNYGAYGTGLSWDGILPDSFKYEGISGGWAETGEQRLFSFYFRFLQEGTFCLETDGPGEWAWLPDIEPLYWTIWDCWNVVDTGTCADINGDGNINIFDITYFIQCKYILIDPPCEVPAYRGDLNNDSNVNIFDIVYLISYMYRDGPPPNCPEP